MPALYEKLGIRFEYPENWTLDESEVDEGQSAISVYSPGGAFWTVVLHPQGTEPEALVTAVVETMREEYDNLDAEELHETISEQPMVGCELNFFCLDLTNTAQIRSFDAGPATYLLFSQAEDREFAKVSPVFRAITASFLAGQQPAAEEGTDFTSVVSSTMPRPGDFVNRSERKPK